MLSEPFEFLKYDKLSDDLMMLGQNVILKFNVSLSKNVSDKRYHFYKEYEYPDKSGHSSLITVKRSFDYYISIENVQANKATGEKAFIRIGIQDIYKLINQLNTVKSWFTDKKYKSLFSRSKQGLVLTSPVPESTMGGYPMNKFIRFIPTIIDRNEGKNNMEPGVEMDLSNYDNYVVMNIDRFMAFHYMITTFNMYLAAQGLVNYIGFHSGVNRISLLNNITHDSSIIQDEEYKGKIDCVNGRTINSKSKKNISSLE